VFSIIRAKTAILTRHPREFWYQLCFMDASNKSSILIPNTGGSVKYVRHGYFWMHTEWMSVLNVSFSSSLLMPDRRCYMETSYS